MDVAGLMTSATRPMWCPTPRSRPVRAAPAAGRSYRWRSPAMLTSNDVILAASVSRKTVNSARKVKRGAARSLAAASWR